jgi:VanZ family protein
MFAAMDEMYQTMNPSRISSFYDFSVDVLGSFFVFALYKMKARWQAAS